VNEDAVYDCLEKALELVMANSEGCWCLSGAKTLAYYSPAREEHILEVWPVAVKEEEKPEGNGKQADELYELAEFNFTELIKAKTFEDFHFSQLHGTFDITWKEAEVDMALILHIRPSDEPDDEPEEEDEDE
jgi:hypothetical protein